MNTTFDEKLREFIRDLKRRRDWLDKRILELERSKEQKVNGKAMEASA